MDFTPHFLCRDCGRNTKDEQYLVPDEIWMRAGMAPSQDLCIDCFQARVGKIAPTDIVKL